MKARSLGTTGLTVSALGLGCMGMSDFSSSGTRFRNGGRGLIAHFAHHPCITSLHLAGRDCAQPH